VAAAEAQSSATKPTRARDDNSVEEYSDRILDTGLEWDRFMDNLWYAPIVEFKKTERVDLEDELPASAMRVIERAAWRVTYISVCDACGCPMVTGRNDSVRA
jgi:hypothetical protein